MKGLICVLIALCAGCAVQPMNVDDVESLAIDGTDFPGQATVYIFRSRLRLAARLTVLVGGKEVGRVELGKYLKFPVPAGKRKISVLSPFPMKGDVAIEATFQAGRTYYFEHGSVEQPGGGGDGSWRMVSQLRLIQRYAEEAASLMATTHSPEASATRNGEPAYASAETSRMTACLGLADSARAMAEKRAAGESMAGVKAYYAARPNAALTVPLVDKVYADPVKTAEDPGKAGLEYAVRFFQECASNLADVPVERSRPAAHCVRNSMVAGMAQESRARGVTRDEVDAYLSNVDPTVREITYRVYERSGSRAEEQLAEWDSCMKPLTGP